MAKQQKISKRIFSQPAVQWLLSHLMSGYIRLVFATSRKTWRMDPLARPYLRGDRTGLFAFWHGRMLLMPCICPPGRKMHVLISHHLDGELIARTMHNFGFGLVRGSSRKGGGVAAVGVVQTLKSAENVSITPDGPRGPIHSVSPGTITLAKLANVPIIPVTFSTDSGKCLGSWDRFLIAWPFGHVALFMGEPLFVREGADEETLRLELETRMRQLTDDADKWLNRKD